MTSKFRHCVMMVALALLAGCSAGEYATNHPPENKENVRYYDEGRDHPNQEHDVYRYEPNP